MNPTQIQMDNIGVFSTSKALQSSIKQCMYRELIQEEGYGNKDYKNVAIIKVHFLINVVKGPVNIF